LPGYKHMGSCLHSKETLQVISSSSSRRIQETAGASAGYWYTVSMSEHFLASFYHTTLRALPPITVREDKWKEWSSQAVESMLPTFSEGGESLVNFVLELKSLKSLFQLWSRKLRLLKNLSGAHLNVSFGWLPFMSDAKRIYGALENFQKKLRKLQEESGKPKKAHYQRHLDTIDLPSDGAVSSLDSNGQWYRKVRWKQEPVYHATLDYVYVLPDMSLMSNQIAGFLDSIGVQLNASIIWNAIPYSFVVDWFLGVGEWINSLRVDNLKIPATVTGFCHSVKYEWQSSLEFRASISFRCFWAVKEIAKRSKLHYERRRDIPSFGLLDLTVKTPNWKQIALGSSLVVQRS
jgi:hypothetical protein